MFRIQQETDLKISTICHHDSNVADLILHYSPPYSIYSLVLKEDLIIAESTYNSQGIQFQTPLKPHLSLSV